MIADGINGCPAGSHHALCALLCSLHPHDTGHAVMAELLLHALDRAIEEVQTGRSLSAADRRGDPRLDSLPPPMIPHSPDERAALCAMLVRYQLFLYCSCMPSCGSVHELQCTATIRPQWHTVSRVEVALITNFALRRRTSSPWLLQPTVLSICPKGLMLPSFQVRCRHSQPDQVRERQWAC